jgi:hypothetical protein
VLRGPRAPDRLEVLARAGDIDVLGRSLAARGLLSLRRRRSKVAESVLADPLRKLTVELEACGFHQSQELAQMRLDINTAVLPCQVSPPT